MSDPDEDSQQTDPEPSLQGAFSCPSTPPQRPGDLEPEALIKTPEKQIATTSAHLPGFASQRSPLSRTEDSCREAQGLVEPYAEARYQRFSSEMKVWFVGPIPSLEFIEKLLPSIMANDASMPDAKGAFSAIRVGETSEKKIYKALCDAINKNGRCPKFYLADTSDIAQNSGIKSMRPDLCLFDKGAPKDKITRRSGKYISHFGLLDLFYEVKSLAQWKDPYNDPRRNSGAHIENHEFLREDDRDNTSSRAIGQTVAYASETNARQHRTHVFSVSVYGTTARLHRWDRSGVIISDLIDLHKNPEILCLFMWRYSHATDPQRGFDTTIKVATEKEEMIFKKRITEHIKEQLSLEDNQVEPYISEHYEPRAVFKMPIFPSPLKTERQDNQLGQSSVKGTDNPQKSWDEVWKKEVESPEMISDESPTTDNSNTTALKERPQPLPFHSQCHKYTNTQYFLVSVPLSTPLSNTGYGTREYWAVKLPDISLGETEYRVVFLKDTWRIVTKGMELEGEIIAGLLQEGVKFVPDIICQGDVIDESKCDITDPPDTSYHGARNIDMYQRTLTATHVNSSWNTNCKGNFVMERTHYRIASAEAGYPLDMFRGTKELIHAGRCGFLAAWAANDLCGRNHRNISLKNIIIVKKRGKWRVGFLINWELSKKANTDEQGRVYAREASWAFQSIGSLQGRPTYSIQDDMEAFYYVILYASVLWLPLAPVYQLEVKLEGFFNDADLGAHGRDVGGKSKISNLTSDYYLNTWISLNDDLKNWLRGAVNLQRPYIDNKCSSYWTPEALYSLWKDTDEKELPMHDRVVNRTLQLKMRGKKQRPVEKEKVPGATMPSVRSQKSVTRILDAQELQEPSHGYNTRSKSSKRRIISPGLEGPSSLKRKKAKNVEEEKKKGKQFMEDTDLEDWDN